MSFGFRLRELRNKKKLTQQQLGDIIHVSKVSISGYENGTRTPDTDTLQAIADYFEVSVDYLLGRSDDPYYKLTETEKKDIGVLAENMLEGLYTDADLDFYGEPMTDEEKERMKTILEMGLQLNKEKAKKKFTNKKYRNNDK